MAAPQPHHRAPASWVHGAFASCVRLRESHDGHDPNAGGNLYGVKGASDSRGNPYSWARYVSRADQDWIAYKLYLRYGVQPWRPYDGC